MYIHSRFKSISTLKYFTIYFILNYLFQHMYLQYGIYQRSEKKKLGHTIGVIQTLNGRKDKTIAKIKGKQIYKQTNDKQ